MRRRLLGGIVAACAVTVAAQAPGRVATTAGALTAFPVFFHGREVAIRHALADVHEPARLADTSKPVYVLWKERPARRDGEIRGEFWDLGRVQKDDPRLTAYDFPPIVAAASNGRWPGRDTVFVILGASIVDSPSPAAPTLRSIALAPGQFENRSVTVSGRFRGANLYGDLPNAPGKSKWDFVLQAADGAVWVTGLRPKGKDFDLNPTARADTGRWLEVTGMLRRDGATVWIAAESVRPASAQTDAPIDVPVPVIAPEPPPTVIFSAPVQDDTEVELSTTVRLQFSRDMDARSFAGHIRAAYVGRTPPGATPPAVPAFTLKYDPGLRALELKFVQPLARFQTLSIELQEGVAAAGGSPLAPWILTFSTGGGERMVDGRW